MTKNLQNEAAISKLKELVDEVNICMFATFDENYNIYSRPMATVEVDEEGTVWFFTNEYSEKVQDISKDNTVNLFYAHPAKNTYVHLKGICTVVNDTERVKAKWNPMMKAWFTEGPQDPKLCFLKVETEEASYWDGTSSKLVTFYKIVKSMATGEKFKDGDKGRLQV
jgi:general stress protein 26